jgi:hypothetical protein
MAIQTRQQANGQKSGLWRTTGVAVGIITLSAAVVASGLGWQGVSAPQAAPAASIVVAQPAELGIDLPSGADIRDLPRGIADYIRSGEWLGREAMEQHPLEINLPRGADVRTLPAGLRDYLRPDSRSSTEGMQSHALGIDLPQGADMHELPTGLTDYIRPHTTERPLAASSSVLGTTMPTDTQRSDLPRGVTDYLRSDQ